MFQDFRLLDHMSAFDNLALPLRLGGASDEQISSHVSDLLGWLGLGEVIERKPPELSMGQRQLVAVGRAVIGRPSLLLADEPTSSVDPARARRLMHLFLSLHRLGTAIVFATHNERLVRRHGFPVLEMADGRLLTQPVRGAACRSAPERRRRMAAILDLELDLPLADTPASRFLAWIAGGLVFLAVLALALASAAGGTARRLAAEPRIVTVALPAGAGGHRVRPGDR